MTLAIVTDAANRVHHQSNHIVNYKTDTHARQESGRAGHSVTGSYRSIIIITDTMNMNKQLFLGW